MSGTEAELRAPPPLLWVSLILFRSFRADLQSGYCGPCRRSVNAALFFVLFIASLVLIKVLHRTW